MLGDARADRYRFALEMVANDPNTDGILVVLTPQTMTEMEATARAVGELSSQTQKPILTCFMGEKMVKAGIDILSSLGVPNYPFPERAARSFRAMADYRAIHGRALPQFTTFDVDKAAVQAVFDRVRGRGSAACRPPRVVAARGVCRGGAVREYGACAFGKRIEQAFDDLEQRQIGVT